MADTTKKPNIPHILRSLSTDESLRRQAVEPGSLDPQLALLREWQANRLQRTYADLLAQERYAPACRFFLSDIYSAKDFSQRDYDLEQLYALLQRFIPAVMLQLLASSIELNRLSNALDAALLRTLLDQLGVAGRITPEQYAQGYRLCNNYAERARQIDLLVAVVREVGEGARFPLVGATLKLAKLPAGRAGWLELHDFLVRGYQAFRQMKGAEEFAGMIERRERSILDKIYAGETFWETDRTDKYE